jgi:hypothetical protein
MISDTGSTDSVLAGPMEVGSLGICQLKRFWSRTQMLRQRRQAGIWSDRQLDRLVINAVGVGLEQALQYLMSTGPTFEEFEQWLVAMSGGVPAETVARINAEITGSPMPESTKRRLAEIDAAPPVLRDDELSGWAEHGFVIVRGAISPAACTEAVQLIWRRFNARPDAPESWYFASGPGAMPQYFHDGIFASMRYAPRIHKAFAQLWGTSDLWPTMHPVRFQPPERPGWPYTGPGMHWDVSLHTPIPFGTQGMLYLTDTSAAQGAIAIVPGFHRRIHEWLASLPPRTDPRQQVLGGFGPQLIEAKAGDLIIWHQAIPHTEPPNRGSHPRVAQNLNLHPARLVEHDEWV